MDSGGPKEHAEICRLMDGVPDPHWKGIFRNILGAVAAAMRPLATIAVATLFSEGTEEVQRVY